MSRQNHNIRTTPLSDERSNYPCVQLVSLFALRTYLIPILFPQQSQRIEHVILIEV